MKPNSDMYKGPWWEIISHKKKDMPTNEKYLKHPNYHYLHCYEQGDIHPTKLAVKEYPLLVATLELMSPNDTNPWYVYHLSATEFEALTGVKHSGAS